METPEVTFVTSFSEDIYRESGKRLIKSFNENCEGDCGLLVYTEGCSIKPTEGVESFDISEDPYLIEWLEINRDIIPTHLGGDAIICSCKQRGKTHGKHEVIGCHWQYMNRNASRWFRKNVSLKRAVDCGSRYLVWIDADVSFHNKFSASDIISLFSGAGVFYCLGNRKYPETGLFGVDLENGGDRFIQQVSEIYTSGAFRGLVRWDDCSVSWKAISSGDFESVDIVNVTQRTNHVIPMTPAAEYLSHNKGNHWKKGIMK